MLELMVPSLLQDFGLCRPDGEHTDVNFFPIDGTGVSIARAVCRTCPVKESCLDHALAHHIDHGVWGGESERARRRMLKRRRDLASVIQIRRDLAS